jgi:tetratricopeptide (TPR) repeat protein
MTRLVDKEVLDQMHKEVINPPSELQSMQLTMRTLSRGSPTSMSRQRFSSSFRDGMSQAEKEAEFVEQLLGHASTLLSNPLPPSHALRSKGRGSLPKEDTDTQKARALLALAKQQNKKLALKINVWSGEASCMVRRGQSRAAIKLLRKCSALLKKDGASTIELANGWLNESAAMSAAGDHASALGCAEKAAAALHENIEKFESSVSSAQHSSSTAAALHLGATVRRAG